MTPGNQTCAAPRRSYRDSSKPRPSLVNQRRKIHCHGKREPSIAPSQAKPLNKKSSLYSYWSRSEVYYIKLSPLASLWYQCCEPSQVGRTLIHARTSECDVPDRCGVLCHRIFCHNNTLIRSLFQYTDIFVRQQSSVGQKANSDEIPTYNSI